MTPQILIVMAMFNVKVVFHVLFGFMCFNIVDGRFFKLYLCDTLLFNFPFILVKKRLPLLFQ